MTAMARFRRRTSGPSASESGSEGEVVEDEEEGGDGVRGAAEGRAVERVEAEELLQRRGRRARRGSAAAEEVEGSGSSAIQPPRIAGRDHAPVHCAAAAVCDAARVDRIGVATRVAARRSMAVESCSSANCNSLRLQ
jgi:hypothetical protein